MPKILTPVNLGSISLSHRVVTAVFPQLPNSIPNHDPTRLLPGGLAIHTFSSAQDIQAKLHEPSTSRASVWQRLNDSIRLDGGTSVARIGGGGSRAPWHETNGEAHTDLDDCAVSILKAGFDGVELDASSYSPLKPIDALIDVVRNISALWGPERVGVLLGPFAWMNSFDDMKLANFYGQLIAGLSELEVAYVHFTGVLSADRGDLSLSPLGTRLRQVFSGMLIASGAYTAASAVDAVEGRWADAVTFNIMMGDGANLLSTIRLIGKGPHLVSR